MVLSEYFLYIISHSVQHHWPAKSMFQQRQSIRGLRVMVMLMFQCDVVKYLPKVTCQFVVICISNISITDI